VGYAEAWFALCPAQAALEGLPKAHEELLAQVRSLRDGISGPAANHESFRLENVRTEVAEIARKGAAARLVAETDCVFALVALGNELKGLAAGIAQQSDSVDLPKDDFRNVPTDNGEHKSQAIASEAGLEAWPARVARALQALTQAAASLSAAASSSKTDPDLLARLESALTSELKAFQPQLAQTRRRLFSRDVLQEWRAVLLPHSDEQSFASQQAQRYQRFQDEKKRITETIEELKDETIEELKGDIQSLCAALKKANKKPGSKQDEIKKRKICWLSSKKR